MTKGVHQQMQMYTGASGTSKVSSKVHVVDAYGAPVGSGDIALNGMNGQGTGAGRGNNGNNSSSNIPVPVFHRSISVEYEERAGYKGDSPTDTKFSSG